jgi:hypothetical protein
LKYLATALLSLWFVGAVIAGPAYPAPPGVTGPAYPQMPQPQPLKLVPLKLVPLKLVPLTGDPTAQTVKTPEEENPKLHTFDTLREAVLYDATRLEDCSHVYECAGLIARAANGQFVTGPVWSSNFSDHVEMRNRVPYGWTLAATIHSHPCVPDHWTAFFSPQDMMNALVTRTISYMVDLCSGDVHEFIPDVTKVDETLVEDIYLTGGNIVGHVNAYPKDATPNTGL